MIKALGIVVLVVMIFSSAVDTVSKNKKKRKK